MSSKRSISTAFSPLTLNSALLGAGNGKQKKSRKSRKSAVSAALDHEAPDRQVVLGVFDDIDSKWFSRAFVVKLTNTVNEMAEFLCERVLPGIRGDDSGLDDHLWDVPFGTPQVKSGKVVGTQWAHSVAASPWGDSEFDMEFDDGKGAKHAPTTTFRQFGLHVGDHCKFTYDYGSTTVVFIRVLAVGDLDDADNAPSSPPFPRDFDLRSPIKSGTGGGLTQLQTKVLTPLSEDNVVAMTAGFDLAARFVGFDQRDTLLRAVPAFNVPKTKRLDALFPHFAKRILSLAHAGFTLGLSHMITSEMDTVAMTIGDTNNDDLFSPFVFAPLDELFAVTNLAYTPGKEWARTSRASAAAG